jgi:hypothetical protein
MKNFQFFDKDTEEIFFVQAKTLEEAKEIAHNFFDNPKYCNIYYSDYVAEQLGYDTY